MLKKENLFV